MFVKPEQGNAREMAGLRQEALHVFEKVVREPLLLLFLRFYIVMEELDPQLGRKLVV